MENYKRASKSQFLPAFSISGPFDSVCGSD